MFGPLVSVCVPLPVLHNLVAFTCRLTFCICEAVRNITMVLRVTDLEKESAALPPSSLLHESLSSSSPTSFPRSPVANQPLVSILYFFLYFCAKEHMPVCFLIRLSFVCEGQLLSIFLGALLFFPTSQNVLENYSMSGQVALPHSFFLAVEYALGWMDSLNMWTLK